MTAAARFPGRTCALVKDCKQKVLLSQRNPYKSTTCLAPSSASQIRLPLLAWPHRSLGFLSIAFAGFASVIAELGLNGISGDLGLAVRTCFVFVFILAFAAFVVPAQEVQALDKRNVGWLAASAVTTAASWVFYYKAIRHCSGTLSGARQFGDFFGGFVHRIDFLPRYSCGFQRPMRLPPSPPSLMRKATARWLFSLLACQASRPPASLVLVWRPHPMPICLPIPSQQRRRRAIASVSSPPANIAKLPGSGTAGMRSSRTERQSSVEPRQAVART